ncbi:Acyl-CoA N-acyltransferase [Penicillium sp. DV-2018c]|nr:Acyl-CoA N-acyltransferase [Penicillium sp. DV-2018c]KAJ5566113.1 Acyl-CoA N-acyltransferase [Penicillium sp. DV-2018c]
MSSDSEICIYTHEASTILPSLVSKLPYSATVLRRIQHGVAHPSTTAHILATFPADVPAPDPSTPWLAAHVDLFRGRETQIVIFSSLEAEHTSIQKIDTVNDSADANSAAPDISTVDSDSTSASNSIAPELPRDRNASLQTTPQAAIASLSASQPVLDLARAQLLALLSYVKTILLPPYLSFLAEQTQTETTPSTPATIGNGIPLIPAPDPQAFLIGGLHTGLFSLLQRSQTYGASNPLDNIRVHRFDEKPYYKYFFRRSVFSLEEESGISADHPENDMSLPDGYSFQNREGREGVLSEHLDLVQSRTHIPRSRAQLSVLTGLAVYYGGGDDPVAWGFLGKDGTLSTLHVEPEHRGKGLAITLSKAVMRRGMRNDGVFGAGSIGIEDLEVRRCVGSWAHADVAAYNMASRRVMEKLGGRVLTTVTWTVIELLD